MERRTRKPLACLASACASLSLLVAATPSLAAPESDRETAWLALLRTWAGGLKPARQAVTIVVGGSAPQLTVRLSLPRGTARAEHFPDGLYGAYAFAFDGRRWQRADTADLRATVAKVLHPGERVTIRLPVKKAAAYRILVQAPRGAAWADSRPAAS